MIKSRKPEDLLSDFMAKVSPEPNSGCWLWMGGCSIYGYGLVGKARYGTVFVHRAAFQMLRGEIPRRLVLDHLCRVRSCVNPAHLDPCTIQENVRRSPLAIIIINAAKEKCPRGHLYSGVNDRGDRICHYCYAKVARNYRERKSGKKSLGPRAERTTCPKGHPYSHTNEKGHRLCKICQYARTAAWVAKAKAAGWAPPKRKPKDIK